MVLQAQPLAEATLGRSATPELPPATAAPESSPSPGGEPLPDVPAALPEELHRDELDPEPPAGLLPDASALAKLLPSEAPPSSPVPEPPSDIGPPSTGEPASTFVSPMHWPAVRLEGTLSQTVPAAGQSFGPTQDRHGRFIPSQRGRFGSDAMHAL